MHRAANHQSIEILELYVPAQLRYLSRLYEWLDRELRNHGSRALFQGFSLYQVDGAFRGKRDVYQERTSVVRLVFDLPDRGAEGDRRRIAYENRVRAISDAVVKITGGREEEVWIIRTEGRKLIRYAEGEQ